MVQMIENLRETGLLFWVGAIGGFLLILAAWGILRVMISRRVKSNRLKSMLNVVLNWVGVLVVAIYIFQYLGRTSWMTRPLFALGETDVTPQLIIVLAFSVIIAYRLSGILTDHILPNIYERYNIETSVSATINTLVHYSLMIIMVIVALNSLGFSFTSLAIFGSVIGVGLGFGLQNIMNNFISGLIILFDRPIRVGDRVIIDDTFTDIEEIKIRHTIVRTRLNERIIIPNSYFLENKFINRSYSNKRLRVTVEVGIEYGDSIELADQQLREAVYDLQDTEYAYKVRDPQPEVYCEAFGDNDVQLRLFFWIDDQSAQTEFILPDLVRRNIYKRFYDVGLNFAFPRRDLYLVNSNFGDDKKIPNVTEEPR